MKEAKQIFLELKLEMLKIIVIQGFLNSIIIFLTSFALTNWILGMQIRLPLLFLTGAYFILYCIYEMRKVNYHDIEQKEPELRDILRTVYDNYEGNSLMVQALVKDLGLRMHNVQPANFFNSGKAFWKFMLILFIAITIPFIASVKVQLNELSDDLGDLGLLLPTFKDADPSGQILDEVVFSSTDEIYGDPSIALLGDEEVLLTIATSFSNIDFTKPTEASSRQFTDQEYINEVYASNDGAFEETIDRDRREVVKAYFKQIQ